MAKHDDPEDDFKSALSGNEGIPAPVSTQAVLVSLLYLYLI